MTNFNLDDRNNATDNNYEYTHIVLIEDLSEDECNDTSVIVFRNQDTLIYDASTTHSTVYTLFLYMHRYVLLECIET